MSPTATTARKATPGRRLVDAAVALTTPLLPDDYVALLDPLWSRRSLRGRVESVTHETFDASGSPTSATLTLRPGHGWTGHTAGQYVRVGVDVDGVRQWRAYSLTCPPGRADGRITVTTKAIPGGLVSNHLVHHLTVGTLVHLAQAEGEFTLPALATRPLLFVTAGSGLTPVMGMLRTLDARATPDFPDTVLVHSAPAAHDVLFAAELATLAARHPNLRVHVQLTDVDGMLGADPSALVPDWRDRETWACGPVGLLDAVEAHWADAGLGEVLHTERFRARILVTGAAGGTVSFTTSGVTTEADGSTPLLDVGEAAGALLPSGCRMGICHGCVGVLRSGAVRDLRTGTVESDEGAVIQTCISAAAGPCEIEL